MEAERDDKDVEIGRPFAVEAEIPEGLDQDGRRRERGPDAGPSPRPIPRREPDGAHDRDEQGDGEDGPDRAQFHQDLEIFIIDVAVRQERV